MQIAVTPKQMQVLKSDKEITIMSCGRSFGKTSLVSIIAILALLRGERVIVCAPVYRTLKDANFREVEKFLYDMNMQVTVNRSELKIRHGKGEIIFLSGEEPNRFRSYTSISTLIFDEAAMLSEDCYKLAYATTRDLNGAKRRIYIVSTPPPLESHWMVTFSRREDTALFYGSAKDNTFIEPDFFDDLAREYEHYPEDFKRRELHGEMVFPTDASSMFNDFEVKVGDLLDNIHDPIIAGLDIAGKGRDFTCIAIAKGKQLLHLELIKTLGEGDLKDFILKQKQRWNFDVLRYDNTGIGHMLEFDLGTTKIEPINFGASGGERFNKARGAIYFALCSKSEIWLSKELMAMHGRLLIDELKATSYKFDESKKINLISKDKIKEQLGRSPDRSDAVALAMSYISVEESKPIRTRTVF